MRRNRFVFYALCLLTAVGLPFSAASQEMSPQTRLQNALEALDRAEPRLDPEMRQYLPVFRAVLQRVYLDRDSATQSEMQLARAVRDFISGSRQVDPRADLNALKSQLKGSPGIKTRPEVVATQRRTPGGKSVGVVALKVGDRQKTVAEIAAAAGGYSPGQRAQQVARRLRVTYQKSPLWWTQAKASPRGKDYVVAAPQAPGGYVITADANYARERGLSRPALARRLVADIRETYDSLAANRDLTELSPEERREKRREEAVDLRQQGDTAYDRGDVTGAEALYRQARDTDPSYVAAYRRLAELYGGRKQTPQRREVLRAALALPGLDATERRELQQMLGR